MYGLLVILSMLFALPVDPIGKLDQLSEVMEVDQSVVDKSVQLDKLVEIRNSIEMVESLEKKGYEVDKDDSLVKNMLNQANEIDSQINNYNDLVNKTGGANKSASHADRQQGWGTFTTVVLVTGALFCVFSLIGLFGHYFLAIILLIPAYTWHALLWAICVSGVLIAHTCDNSIGIALPFIFGMLGCCALTFNVYLYDSESRQNKVKHPIRLLAFILTIVWGVSAILLNSHLIGFMTVGALVSALGFVCGVFPGIAYFGFEDDKVISNATFSSGLILALHVILKITGNTAQEFEVFREGMAGLGSFVFYLGLLIMSSLWYIKYGNDKEKWFYKYLWLQIITIVCGVLSVYIGSVFSIGTLLGIGGTFFYIYLIEKYYEIPWKGVGWLWSFFGLGAILYAFALFAKTYPMYFTFTI